MTKTVKPNRVLRFSRFLYSIAVLGLLCTAAPPAQAFQSEYTPLEGIDNNPILRLPPAPEDRVPPVGQGGTKPSANTLPNNGTAPVGVMPPVAPDPPPVSPPAQRTTTAPKATATNSRQPLRQIAQRMNLPLPLPQGHIVVYKAQRRLELWSGSRLVKTYRVALGPQPSGHKLRQGDGRTPEGQFYICTRNTRTSAFHIFLGLSYPALPDATRAVNNRAITAREYQIIRNRLASRGTPLWETRLGGWIGIHGGSNGSYAQKTSRARGSRDWTAGCIALTDSEIREIHAATKMGTPVLVKP